MLIEIPFEAASTISRYLGFTEHLEDFFMYVNLVGTSPYRLHDFGMHSHDQWEIILNFEGEGIAATGDTTFPFRPGTIICQPPGIPHGKVSTSYFRDIFIQVDHFVIPGSTAVPIFSDDETKSVESLMFMALRYYHRKDAHYLAIVNSLADTIYHLLLSWSGIKQKNEMVDQLKNEIIENMSDPEYQVGTSLAKAPVCSDHLRRSFKKLTGETPVAYLARMRIEYACKLLLQRKDTGLSVAQIALMSGYYDAHYFARIFRRLIGMAPTEYS
jgi:AraC-like DNA-binding protein